MRQPRRAFERVQCAGQPAFPLVGGCDRLGRGPIVGRSKRDRAQPFAFGRRRLERPRELRQRPATRPADYVVPREERLYLVPERARLARAAVVTCRLAHEVHALRGTRARGVEEIAVAGDLIRTCETCA